MGMIICYILKVLFSGKAQSLGIKQGGPTTCHWVELPITKSPKIVQFSVGHEGLHALLTAEDGGVFFVGLARRGEDGDQSWFCDMMLNGNISN